MIALAIAIYLVLVILYLGISFLATSGITYLICMCFGILFTWKIALGIWLLALILGGCLP